MTSATTFHHIKWTYLNLVMRLQGQLHLYLFLPPTGYEGRKASHIVTFSANLLWSYLHLIMRLQGWLHWYLFLPSTGYIWKPLGQPHCYLLCQLVSWSYLYLVLRQQCQLHRYLFLPPTGYEDRKAIHICDCFCCFHLIQASFIRSGKHYKHVYG